MTSISFDRAADYYDATRGYPAETQDQIGAAILATAQKWLPVLSPRILEVGVGTGRIARPIVRRGIDYTGIDISSRMLAKLQQHLDLEYPTWRDTARFLQADATALPFADRSFDLTCTVHVLHLVSSWQQVVREQARVARRPGLLLRGWDSTRDDDDNAALGDVDHEIQRLLDSLGVTTGRWRGHAVAGGEVDQFCQELGARVIHQTPVTWTEPTTPVSRVQWFTNRLGSGTWNIPDEIHSATSAQLQDWAQRRYGADLEKPLPITHTFNLSVALFS